MSEIEQIDENSVNLVMPRPDPRTMTAAEYAKMSVDLFYRAVRKSKEENRTKPIAASTEAFYRKIVKQLEERHGSLELALQWLQNGEGQRLRKTTFVNYRSAIRFMADQRTDTDLLMKTMDLKQDRALAKKFTELNVKRDKNPTLADLEAIGEWLYSKGMENVFRAQKCGIKADPAWPVRTYALLMATYYCGLRPIEWEHAKIISEEGDPGEGEKRFLHVINAKTHYGKVAMRDIPLAGLNENAMTNIKLNLDELHDYLESGAGTTDQYTRHCQSVLLKVVKAVFPKRKRSIQMYSARHACGARWLDQGLPEKKVAYLMGNSTIALNYYGGSKKKSGGAHERALTKLEQESSINEMKNTGTDISPD